MKEIHLIDLVEGNTYFIQFGNCKYKAIFDKYGRTRCYFKKIIRLNSPKDWCGYIDIYMIKYYIVYESQKTNIQTEMETRAVKKILMEITGTEIY